MDKRMPEEMKKLRYILDEKGIEWVDDTLDKSEGFPFLDLSIYRTKFRYKGHHCSVISGYGTYGGEHGLLEMMCDSCDPVGSLTYEGVLDIIEGEK